MIQPCRAAVQGVQAANLVAFSTGMAQAVTGLQGGMDW